VTAVDIILPPPVESFKVPHVPISPVVAGPTLPENQGTTPSNAKLQRAAAYAAAAATVGHLTNSRDMGAALRAAAAARMSPDVEAFVVAHVSTQSCNSRLKIARRKQDKLHKRALAMASNGT
jgi:hypothetical protein